MNRLILALASAGFVGFLVLLATAFILMIVDDVWPSNDLMGQGLPSGCSVFILFALTGVGAVFGFWLSWSEVFSL